MWLLRAPPTAHARDPAAHLPICWGRELRIPHQDVRPGLSVSAASLRQRCRGLAEAAGTADAPRDKGSSSA